MNNKDIVDVVDHLIPISAFSKGQTAKVIEEVAETNAKYIILKNNQPKAMLISLDHFKEMTQKAEKFESLMEKIEEHRLLKLAEKAMENFDENEMISWEDALKEFGITEEEVKAELDKVEIE